MRLTLAIHPITDMRFGGATKLSGTRLDVNQDELRAHLLEDRRLKSVDLDIVHPGEIARVGFVFDVLEPRAKEPGHGPNFPGILDPYAPVGQGTTHVLRGAAVSMVDEGREAPHGASRQGARMVLEMSGPAADASPYGRLQHLVVITHAQPELEWHSAWNAMRLASVKTAVYLAKAATGQRPASQEIYESDGPAVKGREGLPRVAFLGQIHSGHHGTEVDEHIIYGSNGLGMIPLTLHPNEWLDGALVISYTHLGGGETYFYQNHPVILSLYKQHQTNEITFVGTVAIVSSSVESWRDRDCMVAAGLAKWNLQADGAILTRYFSGQPHSDMFMTAQLCERMGIKTVVIAADAAPDGSVESALLMNLPEVRDAVIVGSGAKIRWKIPAAERVIAGNAAAAAALAAPHEISASTVSGVVNSMGASHLAPILY